jgi:hypothetical protein
MRKQEEAAVCQRPRPLVKAARRSTPQVLTYDRFVVTALLPVAGWSSVWWDQGTHLVTPVHVLGLAYRRRYDAQSGRRLREAWREPEEEQWEIVGLDFDVNEGWTVCEDAANFCALMPPTWTLQEFEAASLCHEPHAAPRRRVGP